jgi:hypothetical protein
MMIRLLPIISLIVLFGVSTAIASDALLSEKLFTPEKAPMSLSMNGLSPSNSSPSASASASTVDPKDLHPGKALLLSAILPGAGEYYAGKTLKAAIFFAIEVAAWTGVIYYYNQGQDKDKEFKKFANEHFNEMVYRQKEFAFAQAQSGDTTAFRGTFDEWTALSWDTKIHFLPSQGFTHELPTRDERDANSSDDQQYYEMIGKYIHQFGYGWDDVYIMVNGIVTGFSGDDPGTPYYDDNPLFGGTAAKSIHFMDMRYQSNHSLELSSIAIQVAMLNHVASALDASFTVRAMKRNANAQVGFRSINYDGLPLAVGGLNFTW